jgi:hypothetical protein
MSDGDGRPRLKYLGSFEGGTDTVIIPAEAFAPVDQRLVAERASRELAAEKMKLATMQSARQWPPP